MINMAKVDITKEVDMFIPEAAYTKEEEDWKSLDMVRDAMKEIKDMILLNASAKDMVEIIDFIDDLRFVDKKWVI